MILSICITLLKQQIRSTSNTSFRWLAPIGLPRIPMNHLAIAALGHPCINNLQKFSSPNLSAIPKEEKKASYLSNCKVTFYLEAAELFWNKKKKKKCIRTDILSSLGSRFSSQVENTMQMLLSSPCPTLTDSILHCLTSFLLWEWGNDQCQIRM